MRAYAEASGTHTLLLCTGDELSVLFDVLREANRLAEEEGQETFAGTSFDQIEALRDVAMAERSRLRYLRAEAAEVEGDLVVVGAVLSVTVRISEELKQLFVAALRYFVEKVGRSLTHTLLGTLPDQLWNLHFDLVGDYPGPLPSNNSI